MASSNVNTGFAKCFISFMAIVILLEGGAYLALSIYGIMQESCPNETSFDISQNPFQFVMRLIYFQSEKCGNPKLLVQGLSEPIEIEMSWSKSFVITNRFYIFLITYAAVSALWIVTSLIVLASICGHVTTAIAAISFWPWLLIVFGGSILDGVATGYFIYDVIHTTTVTDTFTYIGADTSNTDLMTILESFDAYFITPGVVLACLSSRVVLIWLLNIFGTGFCLSLSHVLAKNNSDLLKRQQESDGSDEQSKENVEVHCRTEQPQQTTGETSPRPQLNLNENPDMDFPQLSDNTQTNLNQNSATYRNTDTHPDNLNYPVSNPRPISPIPLEHVRQLSTETPLNSRFSNTESLQLTNHGVTAELRSQLPWSYTNVLAKPQVPLKPQRQIYPDIPKPDYAI